MELLLDSPGKTPNRGYRVYNAIRFIHIYICIYRTGYDVPMEFVKLNNQVFRG